MEKNFTEAFNQRLNETGLKVSDIAKLSGVNSEALYKVKYGKTQNMKVQDAVRVAAAFGETIEEFMGFTPKIARDQLNDQIAKLTPLERETLLATIKALNDARQVSQSEDMQDKARESSSLKSS